MTCSILLASFLCSCRQAFSPYVQLTSMLCILTAVLIRSLFGRNYVLFYRSGLTSIWPISIHTFASRVWCLSRLVRYCFLGRWTCRHVSESYRLQWKCCLFDQSTCIPFCLHWHADLCLQLLVQDYVAGYRRGGGCKITVFLNAKKIYCNSKIKLKLVKRS